MSDTGEGSFHSNQEKMPMGVGGNSVKDDIGKHVPTKAYTSAVVSKSSEKTASAPSQILPSSSIAGLTKINSLAQLNSAGVN